MAITGSLLKINGSNVPNLKQYKVTYAKLWADADRNMNGDVRATLIGVFPKIELEIAGVLTQSIVSSLCAILDQPYFSVEFFNPKTNSRITAQYYASDYSADLSERQRELYKPFTVNLVPVSKAA
jgi:hypothetical protein